MPIGGYFALPVSDAEQLSHALVAEAFMRWMLSGTPTGEHVNRHFWKRSSRDECRRVQRGG